jgi:hypothetical protein
MRRALCLVALGASVVAACGVGTGASPTTSGLPSTANVAAKEAGRCLTDKPANVDSLPAASALAAARGWWKVAGLSPDLVKYSQNPVNGTVDVALLLASASTSDTTTGTATLRPLRLHGSMLPPAAATVTAGGSVFFATTGNSVEPVLFTLLADAAGRYYFAGDCAYSTLTQPLEKLLGDRYDAVLKRVVGLTTEAEILQIVAPSASASAR